ncbi:MAG TPA: putative Ig domain-containing protein [Leptospiraceae bacterium]|nr:putative Ig domain-containing protein [Leptospiraceae bacterium]HMY69423.1 putative Ig domain-containing protein [Leptospiraceae bacterium]HNF16215.1 putative Ig domain-containing protein [Leptospiraceae bacterium]HNF26970.1 putative Ig domain-containing protein [Leptospiraceae bacterium]HNM06783.1 putative Ig domain-containing protein [Leptospiraceae bacterium]
MSSKKISVIITVFLTLFLFHCPSKDNGADKTKLAVAAAVVTAPKPAYVFNSLTYSSTLTKGSKGYFAVPIGTSFTLTASAKNTNTGSSTPSGYTVKYSVKPDLPSGLTLDTATGNITGVYSAAPSSKTEAYTVTGTFTAQSGYAISGESTVWQVINLYIDTSTGISNATCSYVGTGGGCPLGTGYSCTASSTCTNSSTCSGLSACYF